MGVVVDERDVVVGADTRVADAEVAPAGEAQIGQRLQQHDVGVVVTDPISDAIDRAVVDKDDLDAVARIVEPAQRVETAQRHLAAVVVQHDDADARPLVTRRSLTRRVRTEPPSRHDRGAASGGDTGHD